MMKDHTPLITAHSGAFDVPANTKAYLSRAAACKPDIIEVDVRVTSDHVLVLHHDPSVSGGSGEIAASTFDQLQRLDPELLTLEYALDFCRDRAIGLNIDIKSHDAVELAAALVRDTAAHEAHIFSGCQDKEVAAIYHTFMGARVLYNAAPWDRRSDYSSYVKDQLEQTQRLHCFGLNISFEDLKPEFLGYSKLYDVPVFVWTVDDETAMEQLMLYGVYSITTNRVELLNEVIDRVIRRDRRLYDKRWIERT